MRPALVWTGFLLCLAVAVAALVWSSRTVLRLERAEAEARAQAALEENTRLALWRMDSALSPLLAQEAARPYFQYSAFYRAGGAYERMFEAVTPGQPLVPSPLLKETPSQVLLHFQIAPDGKVTSPQLPSGPWRSLSLSQRHVRPKELAARSARLAALADKVTPMRTALKREARPRPRPIAPTPMPTSTPEPEGTPGLIAVDSQQMKNSKEFEIRQQQVNVSQTQNIITQRAQLDFARALLPAPGEVKEGTLAPVWMDDALLLTRRVSVNGTPYVQGCWLDWAALENELLGSIRDLLPNARLEPAPTDADGERRLAALPVRLVPGTLTPDQDATRSPAQLSLLGAWAGLLLAAVSVAGLLHGVMALSERRRVFVSAVTHELRTPLTTFRLYTDMLADGMVAEDKRAQYLERLQLEARRLGHLVENVLFYARLDSGRARAVRESMDLAAVVPEMAGRLRERAAASGLELVVEPVAGPLPVRADASAIEQILVNLVDNACKYAASSTPRIVHVELGRSDGRALLRVRDHGPGLSTADRRRLFRPFSKSDREAAHSAPGVGLGLALSRRLARAQGGDLRHEEPREGGAAFLLSLPIDPSR